jgi:hypothetical protein
MSVTFSMRIVGLIYDEKAYSREREVKNTIAS